MTKYEINQAYNDTTHKQTVEAGLYKQEGDYFVFYKQGSNQKVLTLAAKEVITIDVVADGEA